MLEAISEKLGDTTTRSLVHWEGARLSVQSVLDLCQSDHLFRSQFIDMLAASPFPAYFWEIPAITTSSLTQPFEFVLLEARTLITASPDIQAFQEHFVHEDKRDGIVVFDNLGHDATLIVPCPLASAEVYTHLAAFVRNAPASQKHALFKCIADEVLSRLSEQPLWLSTAGMGVYWLHVRLDSRPKYFRHTPYKSPDSA